MNKRNLLKLAKFLEGKPKHFNMRNFASKRGQDVAIEDVDCKTVCCAVGFSPIIFPRLTAKFLREEHWNDSWGRFSTYLYDTTHYGWSWLFSSSWSNVDNTPSGAAMRIRYLTKYGVPDWFDIDCLDSKDVLLVKRYREWKRERTVKVE